MIRKYTGNRKSIEAHSDDGGRTWFGKFFDEGRLSSFSDATLAELEDLAKKNQLQPAKPKA